MKKTCKILIFLILSLGLAQMFNHGLADTISERTFNVGDILDSGSQNFYQNNKNPPIINVIVTVIEIALRLIGSITVIMFIVAGFIFMFSDGNQQRIDQAKEIIKYAIIGVIVAFLSYLTIISIQSLFLPNA